MQRRLYPASKYPGGHPDLARSLANVGVVLLAAGSAEKALPFYEQALAMQRTLGRHCCWRPRNPTPWPTCKRSRRCAMRISRRRYSSRTRGSRLPCRLGQQGRRHPRPGAAPRRRPRRRRRRRGTTLSSKGTPPPYRATPPGCSAPGRGARQGACPPRRGARQDRTPPGARPAHPGALEPTRPRNTGRSGQGTTDRRGIHRSARLDPPGIRPEIEEPGRVETHSVIPRLRRGPGGGRTARRPWVRRADRRGRPLLAASN